MIKVICLKFSTRAHVSFFFFFLPLDAIFLHFSIRITNCCIMHNNFQQDETSNKHFKIVHYFTLYKFILHNFQTIRYDHPPFQIFQKKKKIGKYRRNWTTEIFEDEKETSPLKYPRKTEMFTNLLPPFRQKFCLCIIGEVDGEKRGEKN